MNFEEITFGNMIWFYKDELRRINNGENATEIFSMRRRTSLIKKEIIKLIGNYGGGRKHILTDKTKKTLESMR